MIDGKVLVIMIESGLNKPYIDTNGFIWVKSGSNKRKVTSREELQRIFQSASLIHADETPVRGSSIKDIDIDFFDSFFEKEYGESVDDQSSCREVLLENMNLAHACQLNICGMLLFSSKPNIRLPTFIVKAIAFPCVVIEDEQYIDSRDIKGKLSDIYRQSISFVLSNIRYVQNNQ